MIGRIHVDAANGPATRADAGGLHESEFVELQGVTPVPLYPTRPGLLRSSAAGTGNATGTVTDPAHPGIRRTADLGPARGPDELARDTIPGAALAMLRRANPGVGAPSGPAATLRRHLAPGRYRLNTESKIRDDTEQYTVMASLPPGDKVTVLDKGGRKSLFRAGWFLTNEHSWSQDSQQRVGWIDDSDLDYSLADELEDAVGSGAKPTIEQLQKIIERATPKQRKQAADDQAFLSRAKTALDEDTYLGLLPALGVHQRPTKPQLSQGGPGHTTGADADRAIRTHLQQYLAEAVKAGRKVEGEVSVVGDEDFQMAFDRQWVRAAGQTYPGKKARDVCNAFVDVNLPRRHIWVHRDMGDTGTVIHEGMHKYADATLRDAQIELCKKLKIVYGGVSRLDEGITEYFTRHVVAQLGMRQRVNYEGEYRVAAKLARRFGAKLLASAYYDGKFDALQKAIGSQWNDFAEHIEKQDWKWLSSNGFM